MLELLVYFLHSNYSVRRRGLWALKVARGTSPGREGQVGHGRGSFALDFWAAQARTLAAVGGFISLC